MALLIHLLIAFSSLFVATLLYIHPTRARLQASYALIAGTLASGTYLIISAPSHLLEACVMGLAYLAVVGVGTVFSRQRLYASN